MFSPPGSLALSEHRTDPSVCWDVGQAAGNWLLGRRRASPAPSVALRLRRVCSRLGRAGRPSQLRWLSWWLLLGRTERLSCPVRTDHAELRDAAMGPQIRREGSADAQGLWVAGQQICGRGTPPEQHRGTGYILRWARIPQALVLHACLVLGTLVRHL